MTMCMQLRRTELSDTEQHIGHPHCFSVCVPIWSAHGKAPIFCGAINCIFRLLRVDFSFPALLPLRYENKSKACRQVMEITAWGSRSFRWWVLYSPSCLLTLQAVNRPVLRLQTLLRMIHGIDSTRGALLAELASALAQGPWNQRHQHMHDDSYKVCVLHSLTHPSPPPPTTPHPSNSSVC